MADNLDLAIRIRADLQSALSNLKRMEGGVDGVDRSMKRAGRGADTGSSPLARGTRPERTRAQEAHRFIPARAGNTSSTPSCGPDTDADTATSPNG